MLHNVTQSLGLGRILWNNHDNGKWDVRLGMWNVRSMKTEASELAKYNLDLVAVQEVIWDKGCNGPVEA
jgi:hypothetical protein